MESGSTIEDFSSIPNSEEYLNQEEIHCYTRGTPSTETEIIYDDSFITKEDKLKLLDVIKTEVDLNPEYNWADDIMTKCIISWKYKKTCQKINKDDYLKEQQKIDEDVLTVLD
jgi:hypothetical protein